MTSEDSSSSSGDSEVEWEDVEPLQQGVFVCTWGGGGGGGFG